MPRDQIQSDKNSAFEEAMARYESGTEASELLNDFQAITTSMPDQHAGWTCLAWLQLLCDLPDAGLKSARIAVKLNSQDPQSRINLSLALLETNSKGVRGQIDVVKKMIFAVPELKKELENSIADGLQRKPDWKALKKIKSWLDL